jgi:tetratricopeptide (TPR) repeat protein
MIIHKALTIQLKETQIKQLKSHYRPVIRHLEEGFPLKMKVLETLKNDLSVIVNELPQWQEVLHAIHDSDDFYCVRLMHSDNEILNLPWSMAVDNKTNKQLGNIERLYLTKTIPECFEEKGADFPKAPAPLKVLIMISSPEDTEWEHRLSYEEEEYAILEVFEPLMQQGAVEVDFTEDGSLEALERKLKTNKYHILHFSGHAIFREKEKTGYLQLEAPLNLKTHLAEAENFASVVNCHSQHKVPMVMLASCQTAQGNTEEGLRGVTNHLLRQGVPVVISMGMAVQDKYAALFSAYFYRELAEKKTIFSAFNAAIDYLRNREYSDLEKKTGSREIPLQWIIPNLYLSRKVEEVVEWNQPQEELKFSSQHYIFGQERLLLSDEKDYRFIGRRKDKAEILGPFFGKVPVLLKGQGGVGKTAMAEHLVQRLMAKEPMIVPFLFDETIRSIKEILNRLQDFLIDRGQNGVIAGVNQFEKAMDKFQYLLFRIKKNHQVVFGFDNLETFQKSPGEHFNESYSDIKEVIEYLCERRTCYVILTCRYPVQKFKNLYSFDLNQVCFNDFWRKCLYVDVGNIYIHLREKASIAKAQNGYLSRSTLKYIDVAKLLHETFGGNYRALQFFDRLVKENPDRMINSLDSMKSFQESYRETSEEVKQSMSQNLLFSQMMSSFNPQQQGVLEMLSHFRVPVLEFALALQMQALGDVKPADWSRILEQFHKLTMIEITVDAEIETVYYYVTPLVKDLLEDFEMDVKPFPFSHEQAGIYYYHMYYNMDHDLPAVEEAFFHFDLSGNKEKMQEIGDGLSRFYFDNSIYESALFYANRIYSLLGPESGGRNLNRLGLIYRVYGEYEKALSVFHEALDMSWKDNDKTGEAVTLNNIGLIYHARGEYESALDFFKKGYEINLELDSKSGQSDCLGNIGQTYLEMSDYENALKYSIESLEICRELGDKSGEGIKLNNIGLLYRTKGELKTAFEYFEKSLKISREIGHIDVEASNLSNLATISHDIGDSEEALKLYEQSLRISQEIGDADAIASALNNISQTYRAQRDYDSAQKYLKQSLKISREIGDKASETTALNNLATNCLFQGNSKKATDYLEQSLNISRGIGNKALEASILSNFATTAFALKEYDVALNYLEKSLNLSQVIQNKPLEQIALGNIGQILIHRGDYSNALKYLKQRLKIVQELGKNKEVASTLNKIGEICTALGDYGKATECLLKSVKINQEIGDKLAEGIAYNNLASIAYNIKDFERALIFLEKSLQITEDIGDIAKKMSVLNNIGQLYFSQGDTGTAARFFKQSLKISREVHDKAGEAAILNNIIQLYLKCQDYDNALKYYKQSLKLRRELGDKTGVGGVLDSIGNLYFDRGDYESALNYFKQSLKIKQELGDREGEGKILISISSIYRAYNEHEMALQYLRKSLNISYQLDDQKEIATIIHNMAVIALEQDDLEEFFKSETLAYKIFINLEDSEGIYQVEKVLGYGLYQNGMKEEGIEWLERCYQTGKSAGYPDIKNVKAFLERGGK